LALAQAECQSNLVSVNGGRAEPPGAFTLGPWREVARGVFLAVAEPDSVNLGLIMGSERALLVDTGSSPAQGRAVRESLRAITDIGLAAVVVTHWHHDHAFGLAAFADLETIGHESVRDRLRSGAATAEADRLGVDPAEVVLPNRDIVVAAALDLGGRRVEIAHLGRGHTDGDVVVVVPDADLVFAGDLIESAGPPSFGPDSVGAEWAGTLDGLIGLMTAHTVAVPGHGDPVNRQFVFEQRGRIAAQAAGQPPQADRPTLPLV
jgi:glyoxylase-like metal-dependent hydrolase (beta-lactamase superfamily II)